MQVKTAHVRKALESLRGGKRPSSVFGGTFFRRLAYGGVGSLVILLGILNLLWLSPRNNTPSEATVIAEEVSKTKGVVSYSSYSVQISSFKKKKLADWMVEKVRQEGLEAFEMAVQLPEIGTWYRIMVGQYETREEAQSLANRLRENGLCPYSVVTTIPQKAQIKTETQGPKL